MHFHVHIFQNIKTNKVIEICREKQSADCWLSDTFSLLCYPTLDRQYKINLHKQSYSIILIKLRKRMCFFFGIHTGEICKDTNIILLLPICVFNHCKIWVYFSYWWAPLYRQNTRSSNRVSSRWKNRENRRKRRKNSTILLV